jgi:hypothetical protein
VLKQGGKMQEIYDTHKMENVAVKTSKRNSGDKNEIRWTDAIHGIWVKIAYRWTNY